MSIFDGVIAPELVMAFATGAPYTQVDSADIRQISINRGRSRNDLQYDVGTLTVVLDNNSGIYDPEYTAASSFVSAGVSVIQRGMSMYFAMDWDGNYYGQFFGYLENVVINQGLDTTATLTFTDGLDLLETSNYPASFYKRDAETTSVRLTTAVALSTVGWFTRTNQESTITNAVGNGTSVTYTGDKVYFVGQEISKVEGITPSAYNFASRKTITAVSGTSFTVASTATGTYSSGGTAFLRHVTMQATYGNKTPLSMMKEAARCEGTDFYATWIEGASATIPTAVPTIVFQPVNDKFNRPTILAFSDSGAVNTLAYNVIETNASSLVKINKATVAYPDFNSTGKLQVSALYNSGEIATPIIEAPVYNSWAGVNLAVYNARKLATPIPMVTKIAFQAIDLDTLFPDLLTMDLADQVTVERNTVDGRTQNYDLVVEGINHYMSPNSWTITLATSGLNPYYTLIDKSGG